MSMGVLFRVFFNKVLGMYVIDISSVLVVFFAANCCAFG